MFKSIFHFFVLFGRPFREHQGFAQTPAKDSKPPLPTVVLVHGAFAESSSWNPVITKLLARNYPVVAVADPLRGLKSDSEYVAAVLASIQGPVVLVGHSYAGAVVTNAAVGHPNVKALVYVAGFAPELGESSFTLSMRFPGSTLGPTLAPPVVLSDGGKDLYIQGDKFRAQFAADVPAELAALMSATQRPVTEAALNEAADTPAWKTIPSWFIFGQLDKNIPARCACVHGPAGRGEGNSRGQGCIARRDGLSSGRSRRDDRAGSRFLLTRFISDELGLPIQMTSKEAFHSTTSLSLNTRQLLHDCKPHLF